MKPETILNAYTRAVRQVVQADEDVWDYLETGLYWRASAAAYLVTHYRHQAEVFRRRLLHLLVTEELLGDYEAVFGRRSF